MAETQVITEKMIRSQSWKFYFILAAWPLYLFTLPYVYSKTGIWSVLYMIFPGIYLFSWLGYLMHETWHKYVPGIPNEALYNIYSWMLLTDPQVYRILHGHHHSQVNTWEDAEFHPLGEIKDAGARKLYNFLEISLGIAFLSVVAQRVLPGHPVHGKKYRAAKAFLSFGIIVLFMSAIGTASAAVFKTGATAVVISYAISIWLHSFFLHHSQLIEHGNLIVRGSWEQRNIKTRNLRDTAWPEKLFLFMTHGDSREHVLHHTMAPVYSRPFPHMIPMPQEAVYVNLKDYMGILKDMLAGRIPEQPPEQAGRV